MSRLQPVQFTIGQSVRFTSDGYAEASDQGVFTVTRLLPRDDLGLQYHVRSARDGHTRRVYQSQITAMPDAVRTVTH